MSSQHSRAAVDWLAIGLALMSSNCVEYTATRRYVKIVLLISKINAFRIVSYALNRFNNNFLPGTPGLCILVVFSKSKPMKIAYEQVLSLMEYGTK